MQESKIIDVVTHQWLLSPIAAWEPSGSFLVTGDKAAKRERNREDEGALGLGSAGKHAKVQLVQA